MLRAFSSRIILPVALGAALVASFGATSAFADGEGTPGTYTQGTQGTYTYNPGTREQPTKTTTWIKIDPCKLMGC